jgi:hypothetical protein
MKLHIIQFLQPPVTSSLLSPNSLFRTLFSDTFNLLSSLNVRDKVPLSYNTTGEIIVLYILIFMFLDGRWEDKIFQTVW